MRVRLGDRYKIQAGGADTIVSTSNDILLYSYILIIHPEYLHGSTRCYCCGSATYKAAGTRVTITSHDATHPKQEEQQKDLESSGLQAFEL